MNLRQVGFFHRMPKDQALSLLRRLQSEGPEPNEQLVLAYLKGGTPLFLIPAKTRDLLVDGACLIAAPHVYTDGVWVWTADVAYYVERHHIAVPTELRSRMEANGWMCPQVTEIKAIRDSLICPGG